MKKSILYSLIIPAIIQLLNPSLIGVINADDSTVHIGSITVQGITEPFKQAIISSQLASRITAIRKNEGSFAKKGDTIMDLDFEEAKLEAERNRVISESYAEFNAAKYRMQTAKLDLDATKIVHDSTRSVSEEELWKKELDYNLAKTEYDRLSMTKQKEILEYKISQQNLKLHFIIAPYDGIVAQRFLNEAESCKPQEPLIKFVDVHKCRFITYVPCIYSQKLTVGKSVTLALHGSNKTQTKHGVIEFISPVVDASSGLRTVKVIFDNANCSIQPGITGSLFIEE
jgi:RND family efflux transporter MFP subunit